MACSSFCPPSRSRTWWQLHGMHGEWDMTSAARPKGPTWAPAKTWPAHHHQGHQPQSIDLAWRDLNPFTDEILLSELACQTSIPDLSCHLYIYNIYIYICNMYIMLFASIRCLSDNCTTSCIQEAGTTATQRSSSLPRPVTATLTTHFSSKWSKLFQDHL